MQRGVRQSVGLGHVASLQITADAINNDAMTVLLTSLCTKHQAEHPSCA